MELLHLFVCALVALPLTHEAFVPSFLRHSVEKHPDHPQLTGRRAAYANHQEFGTKALPLRHAVESVPNPQENSRRLPLRDAVERRLPPDEPTQDVPTTTRTPYNPFQQYFRQAIYEQHPISLYKIDNYIYNLYPPSTIRNQRQVPNLRHSQIIETSVPPPEANRVVCYIQARASYRKEPLTFSPEDLDPFACTHVIYAFATIDPHSFNMISNDDENDIVKGGYRSVAGLKRLNPKLKVLISVGENREDGAQRFSKMVASAGKRRDFIRSAIALIRTYQFDGLDVHWQYPGAEELGGKASDKEYFSLLLDELHDVFEPKGWLLTVVVPASRFRVDEGFDPRKLAEVVDFVNLQAYDFHRDREPVADHHANLKQREFDEDLSIFLSVEYAVKFWIKKGLPRSQLVVGVPFFGRSFTLQSSNLTEIGAPIKGAGREGYYTQTPGFLAYFEICDMLLNEGWTRNVDGAGSPYIVYGDQWVGYDDADSIARKIAFVKDNNLGGVYVYAADLDDFKGLCGVRWPLLSAINRHLKGTELITQQAHPTKPYGSCEVDGIFSDPTNCAAYYICRSGLSYHLSCGEGMMFHPDDGKCDYISGDVCKPGQTVYIPNRLRDLDNLLSMEKLKAAKPKVVCYATNWAFYRKGDGKFVPEQIDSRLCTHVIHAFASLDPEKLMIKEFDPWADINNNLYERITALSDSKVLLSIGGWTDSAGDKYSRLVSDGSARRRFVIGVVAFLRKHHFRGLHFDWNYPVCWQSNCKRGASSDKPNYTKLIQELKQEFDKQSPPLILAAAISGYKEVIDVSYDLAALGKAVDFLSVMTYDYHGAWESQTGHVSPLYHRPGDKYPQYNTNYTMEYLVALGAPREKLLVGVPFYGQSFTLAKTNSYEIGVAAVGPGVPGDYTKQPGMLAYYEICDKVRNERWVLERDRSGASGPYAHYRDQWVGFEDVQSVRDKANYIKSNGFGGAVAWTIDLDDFSNRCCGGSFALLRSLNRGLGRIVDAKTQEDCTKPPAPITPTPPQTTTGIDSGAASTTEHVHHETTTWGSTSTQPVTWWKPEATSSTQKTSTNTWWPTSTSTVSTTTRRRTTTTRGTTSTTTKTTTSSWQYPSTTIPPPAVVMPEVDKPPQSCESGQYLPDPQNCNAYYRCILNELKKQYCAGGLHWNKERLVCDWPSEAKCEAQKPAYKPTTNSWNTRTTPTPPPKPTTTQSTTTTTTTESNYLQLVEQNCMHGQYYPHEQCSNFYICDNGQLIIQSCAPGLSWDAHTGICDWRFKVTCMGRKQLANQVHINGKGALHNLPVALPYSKCSENAFAGYPGDCTKYLHCLWGKYDVFNCAPGLNWNSERKICDWPASAKCDGNSAIDLTDIEIEAPSNAVTEAPWIPPTSTSWTPPSSTDWQQPSTSYPEWKPEEWHPPIPPTSEKPPLPEALKPQSGYFKIVCYFTNWAWYRKGLGKYLPEDIDPDLCTHIVYGFAVLDFENLVVKAHDSWADFDNQFYKRVTGYKAKGVKVSLALGGWNDSQGDKYSRLVNNPAARARFIKHVLELLEKWDFDGLDLDWEYPKCWQVDCKKGPDSDKQGFAAWVTELKRAFRPKGYLLSAAVSPSKLVIDAGYDVPVLAEHLDWVAVMTYDYHGQWDKKTGHVAPLYYHPDDAVNFFNSNFTINYWINGGVPRRKIVMGMPLYGQSFRLEKAENNGLNAIAPGPGEAGEFTRAAGFLAYYEICDNIKNKGWTVVQDPERRVGPYAYKGDQWVSFDDKEMIRRKSEFIRTMDLGGGMIWALDLDDFKNRCGQGRHPLLTTIRNTLADKGSGETAPERPPVELPEPVVVETEPPSPGKSTTQAALVDQNSDFKVVCYFTNWAWYRQGVGKYLPSDIDPDLCTHVVYGFAVLNADQLIIKPHDSWADFDNKFYEKVTALKTKGIKVLIAIGGWNDSAGDKYSKLVNNPSARRRFISHVVDFIESNSFDGLDLDWEYPKCWQVDCNKGPASDKPAFAAFIKELHEAFQPKGLLLSAAVSPSRRVIEAGYDVPVLSQYLDWIAVMAYDYHGQWDKITGHVAPMYEHPEDIDATFNTNFTIHYWIEQGADRKKLVMGMPTYGQSFSLADNTQNGLNAPTYGGGEAGDETRARGFLAYYEICQNVINKNWEVVRDRKGRIGPYAHLRDQWVSFDDIGMIRHKSEYVKAMGLGGGMIWALDLDDFKNLCGCEEYPLLRTINRVLRGYAKPDPKCVLGRTKPPTTTTTKPTPTSPSTPEVVVTPTSSVMPCDGRSFAPHDTNCNQYYLCNQGQLLVQACPGGLFWNRDHCDWPENSACHPDSSTTSAPATTAAPSTSTGPESAYKVVCYFTNWAWYRQGDGKYLPSDIDASLCTHINYGFAVLDPATMTLKPHDSWADIDNNFYEKVVSYKAKGIKVLIALGGWNDSLGDKYSRLVNDAGARARFIEHVVAFIEKWGFDGLDLDWEYPKCWQVDCNAGPEADKQGFADFVRELSGVFKPKGLLLSAAVSPSKAVIDAGYDVPTLGRYFDWIAVMTYDYHGQWDKRTGHVAPLYHYPGDTYDYFHANFSINYWIEKGAPASKIIMGMPLYGQSFSLANTADKGLNAPAYGPGEAGDFTRAAGFLAFYEICEKVKKNGWTVTRDPEGRMGPYAYHGNQWVSYDDIADIRRKSKLVKELNLGGGMVWALDLDDFRNRCGCGKHPLLKTLNNELRGTSSDIALTNCT